MKTVTELLKEHELDPNTWKLHEHIRFRMYCCKHGVGEGYGEIQSLKNVLRSIDYRKLVLSVQMSEVGDLFDKNQKREFFQDLISYIDALRYLSALQEIKTI